MHTVLKHLLISKIHGNAFFPPVSLIFVTLHTAALGEDVKSLNLKELVAQALCPPTFPVAPGLPVTRPGIRMSGF